MVLPEIRLMRAAIAVAEELNFSRAAQKLHISQPTLTKQIADLEELLGFPLFERGPQAVIVTDAGRAFVEEARIAVLHCERAVTASRAAMESAEAILHVGKSPYTDPFLTTTLLSIRLPLYPHLKLELSSHFSYDLAQELIAGNLDLAIATEPPQSALLTTVKVAEAPFYIGMSKQDELARLPSVKLDNLANRSWVIFHRRLHPLLYDAVMRLAEERGIAPAKIQHVTVPEEAFQFVADGSSVAFLVKVGALTLARSGITVRPLVEDALWLKTYLASRADNDSRAASELVRAFVRKISHETMASQLSLPMPSSIPF